MRGGFHGGAPFGLAVYRIVFSYRWYLNVPLPHIQWTSFETGIDSKEQGVHFWSMSVDERRGVCSVRQSGNHLGIVFTCRQRE
jgi:hypothetical protein